MARPAVDPTVLAVLAASAELVWPRVIPAPEPEPRGGPAWRFSGRWWARPVAVPPRPPLGPTDPVGVILSW